MAGCIGPMEGSLCTLAPESEICVYHAGEKKKVLSGKCSKNTNPLCAFCDKCSSLKYGCIFENSVK